jgi:ABC-2 type transport system ATP-binding protein
VLIFCLFKNIAINFHWRLSLLTQFFTMNILEVHDLKKYFATQKAVDGISMSIEEGSIFGLLGPNGAGKTTLLRMITGIFYQDSGEIIFNGKKFNPEKDVEHIGYMPEERGLYKKMKIGEQAVYLAQLKGLSKADANAKIRIWFEKLEMESWWNKKVEDLSKGMSQKLQFVTTILHDPKLIILDEPFSGLDPVNANLIKDEIFNLAKNGATVIFSTHRMEQVEEICKHIVLVNKGQKVLDGKLADIKNDFKENIYQINADAIPDQMLSSLFDVVKQKPDKLLIKLIDGVKNNDVLQNLINQGIQLHSFSEVLPSLNEIFIKLVEGTTAARQFQKI